MIWIHHLVILVTLILCIGGKQIRSRGIPIRLYGGKADYEGRIEVFHNGEWGTVCNDGFDQNAAKVICNYIGHPSDKPRIIYGTFGRPPSSYIWFDDLHCVGNETSLDRCSHSSFEVNDCDHSQDVAIKCRDYGITCYKCDGLDTSRCQETTLCPKGEVCEEVKYNSRGMTRHTLGCQSPLVCDALKGHLPVVGRKRRQTKILQMKCCSTPLCNRNITTS